MQQEVQQGPYVMLFIFVGLLLGSVLRQIYKKTKIPYTPMLLVAGLILGYFRHHLNVVGQSTSIIEKLNPQMILFIFIPVLIFESGFNCDWFVFRKAIVNIIILAAPGVLWGAILLGSCFKLILGYTDQQLSWYQAFTLGSVLSATDPVAVVALLKELGANIRFNTLIQGEALLNDGTAMVFFLLFMQLAKGNSSSAGQVLGNFVRIGLGGPFLGIIVGFLASLWLKRIINDDILTANITFVACYLCFYVAEFTWLKVSSILSIVVLGLYMSAVGKTKIYPQSQHSLHVIWSYIQYACQTLIFLLTGVIIGVQMIEKSTITVNDWIKMIVFWFLMQAMRLVMVLTFFPLLSYFGYGLSKKQFVVLIYGGLRGALGLCLSLMVGVDKQLPTRFRQLTVFYMSGMATITILLNGLTCSRLVNYVEMIAKPPIKDRLFKSCLKQVQQKTRQKLKELKSNRFLMTAQWRQVEKYTKITSENQNQIELVSKQVLPIFSGISRNEALEQTRFRIIRYLKNIFWQQYETGQCSEQAAKILTQSCDVLIDQAGQKLTIWEIVSRNFTNFNDLKIWMKVRTYPIIGNIAKRIILNRVYFVYDTSTSLVTACEEARQRFEESFPIKKDYLKIILDEIEENISLAETYINELENNYYMIVLSIHTKKAALNLLTEKKNQLNNMVSEGFLDDGQYKSVRKDLDRQVVQLQNSDFKWQAITFDEILFECPMFHDLEKQELKQIKDNSVEKTFEYGNTISLKDKEIIFAYIVISGIVKEIYPNNFKITKGIGNLLSPYSIILGGKSICTLRAASDCKLLAIKIQNFSEILNKNQKFEARIYKSSFYATIKLNQKNKLSQLSQKRLRIKAQKSTIVRLKPNQAILIENGAYCFKGKLSFLKENGYRESDFMRKQQLFETQNIIRSNVKVKAQSDVLLMIFGNYKDKELQKQERRSHIIREQI